MWKWWFKNAVVVLDSDGIFCQFCLKSETSFKWNLSKAFVTLNSLDISDEIYKLNFLKMPLQKIPYKSFFSSSFLLTFSQYLYELHIYWEIQYLKVRFFNFCIFFFFWKVQTSDKLKIFTLKFEWILCFFYFRSQIILFH